MKKQVCILRTMMIAISVLLTVGIGHAQAGFRVSIPFNFTAGTQSFSSGEYTLKPDPMFEHTIVLRNQAGDVLSYLRTCPVESVTAPNSTKLVFNRYGGHYFLAQIWEAGNGIGEQLYKSPVEIEMAKAPSSPGQQIALNFVTH
jgi:hypothetical protein